MNDTMSLYVQIYAIVVLAVSIPLAISKEKGRKSYDPTATPYAYGYFVGYSSIFSFLPALWLLDKCVKARFDPLILAAFAWVVLYGICGIYILQRRKWAWLLGTFLSINPVLWIINGIYVKKRWKELDQVRD